MIKKIITFLLYSLSITAVIGQGRNAAHATLVSSEPQETIMRLDLEGVAFHPVATTLGEAMLVSFEDGVPRLQAGAPDVPHYALSLMLPATGNMEVEILGSEYQDFPNVLLAPSKGNLLRNVNPSEIPYAYGPEYGQDTFFPGNLAELQRPYVWRDARGQAIWLCPVQYNPVRKVLRVYTSLEVRVHHVGGRGENELSPKPGRSISPSFRALYEKTFFNYNPDLLANADATANQRGGQVIAPEKMLILAKDDLIAELEPFVTWKRQMGIHTTVVPLSQAGAPSDAATGEFIRQYYKEHDITYLLIVGDEDAQEPPMRVSGGNSYACENCFGYMDGDDHLPEILVGRFHASDAEQLRIMVQRNLEYERFPLIDSRHNWCGTALASASGEGAGIGDDNQADYEQANEWKTKHLADGYELYWEFYDGDRANLSPTPGDISADKVGDPTNQDIVNVINGRGAGLYNYTGHGWEQGLVSGNFNTDAVSRLRNKSRYPILVSVACCTGNYTNNNGGDCLGEAMQRAGNPSTGEPWGFVLSYCSSDFQSWSPPMEGQDGMNQYLLDADGKTLRPVAGAMALYGYTGMIAKYAKSGESMADFWVPFGEPSLLPRTRLPQTLAATHAAGAFIGTNNITVNSTVEGALVGLYWQGQTLAVGYIENGSATMQFSPLDKVGELVVTLTQFNYAPYQGSISITPASGPYVINQPLSLDDSVGGNNNQKADYGETFNLNLVLNNVGLAAARNIRAVLSSPEPELTILDDTEQFGDLAEGSFTRKSGAFMVQVAQKVADGKVVNCHLIVQYNDSLRYETTVPIRLQAPRIVIGSIEIDDSVGGNGNGRLESGETVRIFVETRNNGSSPSGTTVGKISMDSPWITSNSPNFNLGALAPQSGNTAAFSARILPNAPKVIPVRFTYTATAAPYGETAVFGPFLINPIVESFESQTFQTFPWVMGGTKPWILTTLAPYQGTYCARSGSITHNQKSQMHLVLDVSAPGNVSFARKVNCERDYDFLRFYINDTLKGEWSGNIGWEELRYALPKGRHKLTWSYEKDEIGTDGQDRAWLDEITLPPHEVIVAAPETSKGQVGFNLTPNPSTGLVRVNMSLPSDEAVRLRVFNAAGQMVNQPRYLASQGAGYYETVLDLRHLPLGVYWVELRTPASIMTKKVLVQGE